MLKFRAAVETAKTWRRFTAGLASDKHSLRPEIMESWLRSKAAGVNPRVARPGRATRADEDAADAILSAVSRSELARLARTLAHDAALVMLANAEAQVLALHLTSPRSEGRDTSSSPARRAKALKEFVGARLSEREAGTNCIGLALQLGKPIAVLWHENYAAWAHRWAGYAAPIGQGCAGSLAGALAIIGCGRAPGGEALEMVRGAAQRIERVLADFKLRARLKVLEEFARQQARYAERAILAVSAEGRVLGFSPAMGKLLAGSLTPHAIGQRLGELDALKLEGELKVIGDSKPYEVSLRLEPKGAPERTGTAMVFPLASDLGEGLRAGFLLVGAASATPATRPHSSARSSWRANYGPADFVCESRAAKQVLELVNKAAGYDWPVFMVGESGTGKELLASAIHGLSPRAAGPFVALDCSTIPPDLVASELFGYEEGTFTGAQRGGKPGKLELAQGGTLFLDELADLPLNVQASLLRFLEDSKVIPLGGQRVKLVDARVIAAINIEPGRAIAQGKLRLDLYHRLSVFKIVVPPLRERLEDIAVLARHLLDREGFGEVALTADALAALQKHPWPGNVRELRNVLLRAAASCARHLITPNDLMLEVEMNHESERVPAKRRGHGLDKEQLLRALGQCGWNKTHAAKLLSVHWVTLHRAMQRLGLACPPDHLLPKAGENELPVGVAEVDGSAVQAGEGRPVGGLRAAALEQPSGEAKLRQKGLSPMQSHFGRLGWRQ
jgi:transcriptional regulator of acetoin/glycerol metabolism